MWPNCAKYVGGFVNDQMTGSSSSLEYGDGSVYSGEFKDNKRHGYGTFTFKDGGRYEGPWINDLKDGDGKYTWKDKTGLVGRW